MSIATLPTQDQGRIPGFDQATAADSAGKKQIRCRMLSYGQLGQDLNIGGYRVLGRSGAGVCQGTAAGGPCKGKVAEAGAASNRCIEVGYRIGEIEGANRYRDIQIHGPLKPCGWIEIGDVVRTVGKTSGGGNRCPRTAGIPGSCSNAVVCEGLCSGHSRDQPHRQSHNGQKHRRPSDYGMPGDPNSHQHLLRISTGYSITA
jgi:hypothetical protein